MTAFRLNIELDVDLASVGDLAETAFDWFDGLSQRLAGEARHALDQKPPARKRGPESPPLEPGEFWGTISVTRWGGKPAFRTGDTDYSAKGVRWLREQLADPPREAEVRLGVKAAPGQFQWLLSLRTEYEAESPGWLRLGAYAGEGSFLDPDDGAARQRRWLEALRPYADKLNPGFGQITYGYDAGATGLEHCLRHPAEDRPWYTVGQCRQVLRGYSWWTVVPAELAAKLGGVEALTASSAFHEVSPLRNGGVWLLATADYRDFDDAAAEKVFRVLAPVLRPGKPTRPASYFRGQPPHRIVFEDAATVAAAE